MIEIMKQSEGNVIGIRATGTLTAADYDKVLNPELEAMTRQFASLRALFYLDVDFEGWEMAAAWANTKLDFRYRGKLERVAIVGAPLWERWCVRVASLLMKGELRTFTTEQLPDAWSWVKSGADRD